VERFAAHEKFFVEDVGTWTRSRFGIALPTERTALFGVSTGGELALAMAPDVMPRTIPRTYRVAGTLEPFFLKNATRWATALREVGVNVVMAERVGSHGDVFWREEPTDGGVGPSALRRRG
jgi:hypothetical protein